MKLSAALIYEKLSPRVTNCRMGRGFDRLCLGRPEFFAGGAGEKKAKPKNTPVRKVKVNPNDPCPCGSGKKYKKCCGMKDD